MITPCCEGLLPHRGCFGGRVVFARVRTEPPELLEASWREILEAVQYAFTMLSLCFLCASQRVKDGESIKLFNAVRRVGKVHASKS